MVGADHLRGTKRYAKVGCAMHGERYEVSETHWSDSDTETVRNSAGHKQPNRPPNKQHFMT